MTTTTDTQTAGFDESRSEAFAQSLIEILNQGAMSLMLSIGHRTGLFDVMTDMPPSTSQQIADKADLDERYVREWLGSMATGQVVEYDPEARTYALPAEHAAFLTRSAAPNNLATTMQWIPVLAGVEDEVLSSFKQGGGVHYERFHRFHEVMAAESAQTVVAGLLEHILPLVGGLKGLLEGGVDVLDIGCGSGRALCALAEHFPASRFRGYDLCEPAIEAARDEAQRRGLENTQFAVRDVSDLGHQGDYDLVTAFDAIHDQREPAKVLRQIREAIRPDGTFLMQDIAASSHLERNMDHPIGPFLYTISTMHCMTVSLAQGGAGLGTVWGEELACQMLQEAGFARVEVKQLSHDFMNNYYIAKP